MLTALSPGEVDFSHLLVVLDEGAEATLLARPTQFVWTIPFFAALLWRIRSYQGNLHFQDRALVFEDRPAPIVQGLNISR
jgi:hypothetical protein